MTRIAAYFDLNLQNSFLEDLNKKLHARNHSNIRIYSEKEGWKYTHLVKPEFGCKNIIIEASTDKKKDTSGDAIVLDCDIVNLNHLVQKYAVRINSSNEILKEILRKKLQEIAPSKKSIAETLDNTLRDARGSYAIIGKLDNYVFLSCDLEGVKNLWYSCKNGFAAASEKKFLPTDTDAEKLDPRTILVFDTEEKACESFKRAHNFGFSRAEKECDTAAKELLELVEETTDIRIPDEPFGILFSGGLDSSLIATICKKVNPEAQFTCYTAGFGEESEVPDVEHARRAAERLGVKLKIATLSLEQAEKYLQKLVPLLETTSVPMVGVGLALYAATKAASEDGIKVLLTGSGADEMFGGYNRHKTAENLSEECLNDTLNIHIRDTYRDELIGSECGIIMRAPLLDRKVMEYALELPDECKMHDDENKYVLRLIAGKLGMTEETTHRPKKAAQYGSRSDKAIEKLAKKYGYSCKSDYLESLKNEDKPPLGVLFSSGKDCTYALHLMHDKGYPIKCLITIRSQNPDSYMFHTPNINLAQMQADAMEIPLIEWNTEGEKEVELEDLKNALQEAIDKFGIRGIITGALHSNYQRERIENICRELGIEAFSPLWGMDQENEMRELLDYGFSFIFSSIAAYGLNSNWVGREIAEGDIEKLVKLNEKIGLNVAGEGGEFESFVLDAPLFKKRIEILESKVIELDEYTARFVIEKALLVDK
ncbi:asparagine synthase (glutamine-hydrolyzing) [Methanohalophilus levihalophilus]|uniref:diphthine--ammonia ligase n=1 Tax=Methanohalophilus levihalophilus TaxID=1431282 RepID=UPI001AE798BF|nr:diphthine--ammonia ligase [Methanohalophilus levihalophilus]MBP2029765.1 asparagine synthase (glutamine-hydrolyzing) [Methanohalophilus levihalophilus]